MLPPYLRRQQSRTIGQAGLKSEKRLTKALGGKARPASGAVEGVKGDFTVGDFLVEAKSTTGKSIGLQHSWLGKIASEARAIGKVPAITLSFTNEDGSPVPSGEWVAVKLSDWREMVGE